MYLVPSCGTMAFKNQRRSETRGLSPDCRPGAGLSSLLWAMASKAQLFKPNFGPIRRRGKAARRWEIWPHVPGLAATCPMKRSAAETRRGRQRSRKRRLHRARRKAIPARCRRDMTAVISKRSDPAASSLINFQMWRALREKLPTQAPRRDSFASLDMPNRWRRCAILIGARKSAGVHLLASDSLVRPRLKPAPGSPHHERVGDRGKSSLVIRSDKWNFRISFPSKRRSNLA